MEPNNPLLKRDNTLPENFNGVFYFTNWTDHEFVGTWAKRDYHFAPKSMSPLVIPEHSPLEIQHIRKKFALDLAEQEFYRSKTYAQQVGRDVGPDGVPRFSSVHTGSVVSIDALKPLFDRCLEPLPIEPAVVTKVVTPQIEMAVNENGEQSTSIVDEKVSLKAKAASMGA